MSRKSQRIRTERREKMARKWARNDNARAGTSRSGIAKGSEIGVECFSDDPPLAEGASSQGVSSSLS